MAPKKKSSADRKKNPKLDTSEMGFRAVLIAAGELPNPEREKDPHAVAAGRAGGLKGGKARIGALSGKARTALGKKGARARWDATNKG